MSFGFFPVEPSEPLSFNSYDGNGIQKPNNFEKPYAIIRRMDPSSIIISISSEHIQNSFEELKANKPNSKNIDHIEQKCQEIIFAVRTALSKPRRQNLFKIITKQACDQKKIYERIIPLLGKMVLTCADASQRIQIQNCIEKLRTQSGNS